MCSIYGAFGQHINSAVLDLIADEARDRGRDGGRCEFYESDDVNHGGGPRYLAALGNWRATPTPELQVGALQPYDRLVHNGTIANDKELGILPGEIDSQCLARVLNRTSLSAFVDSLSAVKGSYALALFNGQTVLAAVNYKPLYYVKLEGTIYFSSMARHFIGVLPFGHAPVAVEPYTAIDFRTQSVHPLHKTDGKRVVVVASAGLDSTVVATKLVREGWDVCLLHFTYGCLAGRREYESIPKIAEALGCRYQYLEVDLAQMLGLRSSTLFGDGSEVVGTIAGAEYAHEWVPARNLVFMSLAVAWAEAHGYHAVAPGTNLEEAGAYPDNEEGFTTLFGQAVPYAVQAHYGMRLLTPIGNLMKHEVVKLGLQLGAPFEHTWSCYKGGLKPCDACGPDFMRHEAFRRNGAVDPVFV